MHQNPQSPCFDAFARVFDQLDRIERKIDERLRQGTLTFPTTPLHTAPVEPLNAGVVRIPAKASRA